MKEILSRKQYRKKFREKVEHYKPIIEKKCGKSFGEIKVKDMNLIGLDIHKKAFSEMILEDYLKGDGVGCVLDIVGFPTALIPLVGYSLFVREKDTSAAFWNNIIYLNTSKKMRLEVLVDKTGIDQTAVHELSHKMWEVLGGEKTKDSQEVTRLNMMIEGFATYCERTLFAGIYPVKRTLDYSDLWGDPDYQAGALRMMGFVGKYGKDIIFQIPRIWKKLDKETPLTAPELLCSSKGQLKAFEGKIDYGILID